MLANRISARLQARLDRREPWTPALREDADTLRAILREQRRRDESAYVPEDY